MSRCWNEDLAKLMFGNEDAAIQLDMPEFMERDTASRPVEPLATSATMMWNSLMKPCEKLIHLVVFDEIEKAHRQVTCSSTMEEVRVRQMCVGTGSDFCNAIIVMTSNIGRGFDQEAGYPWLQPERDEDLISGSRPTTICRRTRPRR